MKSTITNAPQYRSHKAHKTLMQGEIVNRMKRHQKLHYYTLFKHYHNKTRITWQELKSQLLRACVAIQQVTSSLSRAIQ
jgi:hypothetical protein